MGSPNAINAVIWDLGGVILRTEDTSSREKWETRLNLGSWGLAKLVFGNEVSAKASAGTAKVDQIWKHVQDRLQLSVEEVDELRRDFFRGDEIDQELVAFIRSLKRKVKSGMITNAWPGMRHYIENVWEIGDAFHQIVISAEVGITKPDPEIYLLALRQLDIDPQEAVFVDDFVENIEGAKAVGMLGIHFRTADEVMAQLIDLLNLQDPHSE